MHTRKVLRRSCLWGRVAQNGVKVKVHVWDEDGRTQHDFVDSLQTRITVAAAASEFEAHWTSFIARARTTSVSVPYYTLQAKFHYASWFGAGSKLVRSQIPLRYLVRTSFEPASNKMA